MIIMGALMLESSQSMFADIFFPKLTKINIFELQKKSNVNKLMF